MVPPARSTLVGADDSIIIFDCQLPIADWRVSDYKVRLKKFNTKRSNCKVQCRPSRYQFQIANCKLQFGNRQLAIGKCYQSPSISCCFEAIDFLWSVRFGALKGMWS